MGVETRNDTRLTSPSHEMREGPRRRRGFHLRDSFLAYVLVFPAIAWVLGIVLYPILYNVWLSLHARRMVEADPPFVGMQNFERLLTDPGFWESARLTLVWTGGGLAVIVPAGVAIALLLNQAVRGLRGLRHWILLPWMFPIVVIVLMWRWILDPSAGVLNAMLREIGLISQNVSFLDTSTAMITVILVNAWRWIPFMAIVTLAALQTVPRDLLEAAAVDGATARQRVRHILLPTIKPTLMITSFMLAMWLFNMFPPVWLMTQGGPAGATTILPIAIYQEGFQVFRQSLGAAMSMLLLVFLSVLTLVYFRTTRQRPGA